jgi:deoxyribodipyrimidine photolyase-related protein
MDQLHDGIGPLGAEPPGELGILLLENRLALGRRPYHQQKLALLLANQRHFALEQARRGVAVRYLRTHEPFADTLLREARTLGVLRAMVPAERELRHELAPAVHKGALTLLPHQGWLTTTAQFLASQAGPPWRMDAFYRAVRRDLDVLMERGKPLGGRFSFDADNRKPWKGTPAPPALPTFTADELTREVAQELRTQWSHHPGMLRLDQLPTTLDDARTLWRWFLHGVLEHFGPYEDAMAQQHRTLFHSRVSAVLNLHRLLPREITADVLDAPVALASKEGFVRQVLGWREFVRHVHDATDGFRALPSEEPAVAATPGDGGYGRWKGTLWSAAPGPAHQLANSAVGTGGAPTSRRDPCVDGGALPSALGPSVPLPPAYWGVRSGLRCLDEVVRAVWDEGYSHHITRLMVLANLATLLDVSPRELTDWFWVAYQDAYDWVVEPNVLGMGTYAAGDVMTTKPYVAGAAYIDTMSDYCAGCAFEPRPASRTASPKACPVTPLYWAFLERHRDTLGTNPRLVLPMASAAKRGAAVQQRDAAIAHLVAQRLLEGAPVTPEWLAGQLAALDR